MPQMILADGSITDAEQRALLDLGSKLNYSAYDIKQLINKVRKRLYQESKEKIRRAGGA